MLDTLIVGAEVIDGTGAPRAPRSVGIEAGRIVTFPPRERPAARRVVRAEGALLTPGLIDPHSHSDWSVLGNRDALSTIHQGVTTEVVGNCGVTHAPISGRDAETSAAALAAFGYTGEIAWRTFAEYLDAVHDGGTAQNLVWFVGHTALRRAAQLDAEERGADLGGALERRLREALEAGAIGFTTGLEYGDGRFAAPEELRRLAEVVAEVDGMYASHIRNRDSSLAEAVDEFFSIVRAGGLRAQLSHLNVRSGTGAAPGAWERAVERLEAERARGTEVLADMTPYPDGIGLATGLLPEWLLRDGLAEAARGLRDPEVRERVRADSDRYWRFLHRGEWHRARLTVSPATPALEGLSFPEITEITGKDEWDSLFDMLAAAGAEMGSVQLIGELFTERHVAEAVAHERFLLGVDGFTSRRDGPLGRRTRHPLFFQGHTHFLAHHALATGTLSLEQAVHKMTGAVAEHFRIAGRGRVRDGAQADLVLFDPERLAGADTLRLPEGDADAARHVWGNGIPVVEEGRSTGSRPGRRLGRSRA
ncbi:N-acyl-D-amino-acid deacylase family protein [Leucobacter massiliensis]|uniref:N-acyl-D-amino-acid deacylase n=1 Tax=Leucobacter massiliensis TaxID=1686285 RepID=A0A2S9QLA9_9MICO|nr:amidohydrolase family protein [Leucobacter massiliensis]PRI10378.1 N-acyl-D-amino-acid deacylase [Leucobacter massiliensis]